MRLETYCGEDDDFVLWIVTLCGLLGHRFGETYRPHLQGYVGGCVFPEGSYVIKSLHGVAAQNNNSSWNFVAAGVTVCTQKSVPWSCWV